MINQYLSDDENAELISFSLLSDISYKIRFFVIRSAREISGANWLR